MFPFSEIQQMARVTTMVDRLTSTGLYFDNLQPLDTEELCLMEKWFSWI